MFLTTQLNLLLLQLPLVSIIHGHSSESLGIKIDNPFQSFTDEAPVEEKVRALITILESLDRTYFGKDRLKKVRETHEKACEYLDTKPIDSIQNKKEKAELLYLRGRVLDFLPEYTRQAEEHLSKCLKLQPSKREAWDALGHVYWKKNDLPASKTAFESSLEQDSNNAETLRNLSMVLR